MMSPGTRVAASIVWYLPSRKALAWGAIHFFNATNALEAFCDCQRSMVTLKINSSMMIMKSSQWPMMAEMMAAASIMYSIGPMKAWTSLWVNG